MSKDLKAELDALKADARAKSGAKEAVSFNVPKLLMDQFREVCETQGLKHSHVIVAFIKSYVRDNQVASIHVAKNSGKSSKKV